MTLRAKLALLFAVVAVGGVACASYAAYASARSQLTSEIEGFLSRRADEIVQGSRQAPPDRNAGPGPAIAVEPDAIVQILDGNGRPVSSVGGTIPTADDQVRIARGGGAPIERDAVIDGQRYRTITRALRRDGGGAVQVARSLSEMTDVLAGLRDRLALIGLIVAAMAAALGWVFATRATGPLRRLATAATHVASTGDLSTRVPVEGNDEVSGVARDFDAMLGALATSREQQRRLVEDAGHELRTPLTALRTDVALLRRAPDYEPAKREALVANIEAEVIELSDLASELVEAATDTSDDESFAPLDLAGITERAVERARRRTGRAIRLDARPSPVVGQAGRLERAVANLLANAHKFSPPDAPIEVQVDEGVVLVRDHGPGIPPDERQRVFDRFFRGATARTTSGSGLGLAIVAEIVRRHGGQAFVASAPDGGAEVGFRLPSVPTAP